MAVVVESCVNDSSVAGGTGRATVGLDERFDAVVLELSLLPEREQIRLANRYEQRLSAQRLVAMARLTGSGGDVRSRRKRARAVSEVCGGSSGRSGRSASREANRAAAIAANPALAEGVARGLVSADTIDAASRAADPGSGAIPGSLIDSLAGTSPDQAERLVEEYLADPVTADEANERHKAQMRARRVRRYTRPADGADPALAGLGIEGPDAVIDELWHLLNQQADTSYRADGGRKRDASTHRPIHHRRFDAAVNSLRGGGGVPAGRGNGGRPSVVVTVRLDDLVASGRPDRRSPVAIGTGPIGDDLVGEYLAHSDLSVLVQGAAGQPLWLGRSRRHASAAQFLAPSHRSHADPHVRAGWPHQLVHQTGDRR